MKRSKLPKQKSGRNPIDVPDFLRRVREALDGDRRGELSNLRAVYPVLPDFLKVAMKREGLYL